MALLSTIMNALLRKGILVGILVLVLIGMVELGLWVFAPVSRYVTYDFNFKNTMKPYGLANSSSFSVDTREVRHRAASDDRDKTVRLLVLGGESNYQPLQDVDDTWWGRLAIELEKQFPDTGVQIDLKASPAGARPGTGSSMIQTLQWAKTYAGELNPDIVVVVFGVSEVLDVPPGYQYDPTLVATLSPLPRPSSIKDKAVSISQIARRLRTWRASISSEVNERKVLLETQNHFRINMGHQRSVYETLRFDANPPPRGEGQDPKLEYLDGLRGFHSLAKRLGAEMIALGEPSLHDDILGFAEMARLKRPRWLKRPTVQDPEGSGVRPDPAWVESELNRYYEAGAKWAAKADVPFVNLNRDDVLPKNVENFVDDLMLTQVGSQRVTDEVSPVFASAIKKFLAN